MNKWMYDLNIFCCSTLSLFLLLYAPWAVKILLIGKALRHFQYYY